MTMIRLIVPASALALAACGGPEAPSDDATSNQQATELDAAAPMASDPIAISNGVDDGAPDLTPPLLTPEAERGETGARSVLLSFARAIELQEFGQAYALLGPQDRTKWTRPEFAALFADLTGPTVAAPTGTLEGAAGSSYYAAPITVTGTDKDGRPVRLEGDAVLRRINDVDGATPAQLRWHFESLSLDWTH